MKHYKIIHKSKVIDVVQNPKFLRFLSSGIAITDKSSAQGIAGSDGKTIYSFKQVSYPNALVVTIKEISLEEFNRLRSLLNSNQEVSADTSELKKVKDATIKNLSNACKDMITSGFSVKLSDSNTYSFRLTAEDQINLLNFENQLNAGETAFIYHATNLPCRIFLRKDMKKIIKAYREHLLYHTTYFNVAKQYIGSLVDINKVKAFTYGTELTSMEIDPTLRQILLNGGHQHESTN
jgi:hypothetical protein